MNASRLETGLDIIRRDTNINCIIVSATARTLRQTYWICKLAGPLGNMEMATKIATHPIDLT